MVSGILDINSHTIDLDKWGLWELQSKKSRKYQVVYVRKNKARTALKYLPYK